MASLADLIGWYGVVVIAEENINSYAESPQHAEIAKSKLKGLTLGQLFQETGLKEDSIKTLLDAHLYGAAIAVWALQREEVL